MEDYSEQIKVIRWGKQETIDRLHVVQSIQAYGYNVLDNKVKYLNHDGPRYLWEGSNRENAVKALEEVSAGEDPEAIQKSVSELFDAAGPVMAKKQAAESAKAETEKQAAEKGEQTVDASFTEVDADEKK